MQTVKQVNIFFALFAGAYILFMAIFINHLKTDDHYSPTDQKSFAQQIKQARERAQLATLTQKLRIKYTTEGNYPLAKK